MTDEISQEVLRRSEALHRLAEALSEDILNTPPETLLAEVAEDHGNRRTYATTFNRMLSRTLRQSTVQDILDWARRSGAQVLFNASVWKPLVASVGILLVGVITGDLYLRSHHDEPLQKIASVPVGSNPWMEPSGDRGRRESRARTAEPSGSLLSPSAIASRPELQPNAPDVAAPAGAAGDAGPKSVRTVTVRSEPAQRAGASSAAAPPPGAAAAPQAVAAAPRPLAEPLNPGPAQAMAGLAAASGAGNASSNSNTLSFSWPLRGRVIAGFGPVAGSLRNDGIDVAVPEGTDIHAADDGLVTAYAHASRLLVTQGDTVTRGQVIAKSGQTGHANEPQLHFEIRKGTVPVDPTQYLSPG